MNTGIFLSKIHITDNNTLQNLKESSLKLESTGAVLFDPSQVEFNLLEMELDRFGIHLGWPLLKPARGAACRLAFL
jgi:hypothetical protein